MEALSFLRMYRRHEGGEIADKIGLFREFYEHFEEIERDIFYRLSAVWLKREHYELETGRRYAEQEHVVRGLQRQNARRFANKEIRNLPVNKLYERMDDFFLEQERFSLADGAHWLVDGNLYAKLGGSFMREIYGEQAEETDSLEDRTPYDMELLEFPESTSRGVVEEEVDKIDL